MKPACRRILSLLLSLSLVLTPLATHSDAYYYDLPDMGAASGNLMTPQQERQLGKNFMRYIRATQKVLDDPLLDDYINRLGQSLVDNSKARGRHFRFFLIDDPQINAFAGPGGHIGVYTGLVLTTKSENELAAVIAHEIAHVTQAHLLRAWQSASDMSLVQGAALIAALLVGAALGGDAGIAGVMGAQAALQQQQINFTRHNEEEADRIGIHILDEARFDPRAMPTFFARMGRANSVYASELPEFLRTHPVTNARIADSLGRAEKLPYRQHQDSFGYLLTRAALREMSFRDPASAVRHFRSALADGRYRDRDATRYGLARALWRQGRLEAAAKEMATLLEARPDTPEFLVTAARIDMDLGKSRQAIQRLEKAAADRPYHFPIQITLADLYLRADRPTEAYRLLDRLARHEQEQPRVHQLLARAAKALGREADSHRHLADYYYLIGALEAAELQLRIALRTPGLDDYQRARLESRLKQVSAEAAELKKEKKRM